MTEWIKRAPAETGMPSRMKRTDRVEYRLADEVPTVRVDHAGNLAWDGVDGVGRVSSYRVLGGVGDVNGTTKGSAARFNAGKPDLSLIPATVIAAVAAHPHPVVSLQAARGTKNGVFMEALQLLGQFQMGGDTSPLLSAMQRLAWPGGSWADCARVFEYGKAKYSAWNWARGQAWSIPIASAMRHLVALMQNEDSDPESGLPHVGHVMCNLVMLLWFTEHYAEGDDRYKPQLLSAA